MAGQFQTSDPLMKRELRLTYEDYEIYKTNIGYSNINLTYDRGVILAYSLEQTGTDIFAMLVNGNGKPEAVNRKLDSDNYKNIGFRVNQSLGDFMTIGGFYYSGKENYADSSRTNKVYYIGPDISIGTGFAELTAQYLYRKDTNPEFMNVSSDIKTNGYIIELLVAPDIDKSDYYFTGLYNLIDSDIYKYETATLSFTYLLARNLRLMTEYTRDLEAKRNRFVVGIIGAF